MTKQDGGTDRKEFMMIKKCLMAALLLGMMVAGCDDGSTDDAQGGGGTDSGKTQPTAPVVIDIDGINSTESWNAAVSRIKNGASNESYRLVITGSFGVPGSTASTDKTFGSRKGLYVEIAGQGTGRKISLTSNGTMLRIDTNQHLTLKDITLQGKTANNAPLVYVTSGALEMTGSAAVSGNGNDNTYSMGGGVWLNGSTMTMSGNAQISGNTGQLSGGGVVLSESTMTMSGNAAISGNETAALGGGVYLYKSTMTMSDNAQISSNKNTSTSGGGVFLSESTMTMNGYAAISGNEAVAFGGGVSLSGSSSTMTMNDSAVISGNKATDSSAGCGGGIFVKDAAFRMAGGTVYGNTESATNNRNIAAYGGASLYLDSGTAQYGTFNGSVWSSNGTLATRNNTITVVNGELK